MSRGSPKRLLEQFQRSSRANRKTICEDRKSSRGMSKATWGVRCPILRFRPGRQDLGPISGFWVCVEDLGARLDPHARAPRGGCPGVHGSPWPILNNDNKELAQNILFLSALSVCADKRIIYDVLQVIDCAVLCSCMSHRVAQTAQHTSYLHDRDVLSKKARRVKRVQPLFGIVCFLRQRCAPGGRFPCGLALGSHLACPISTTSPP